MAAAFARKTAKTAAFTWTDDEQHAFQDFRTLVETNSSGSVAFMVLQPACELSAIVNSEPAMRFRQVEGSIVHTCI
jgi:hypothetical protein